MYSIKIFFFVDILRIDLIISISADILVNLSSVDCYSTERDSDEFCFLEMDVKFGTVPVFIDLQC